MKKIRINLTVGWFVLKYINNSLIIKDIVEEAVKFNVLNTTITQIKRPIFINLKS